MDVGNIYNSNEEAMTEEDELKQKVFYTNVRETIISLLLVVLLYLLSYWLVEKYKRHRTREECYSDEEDATVYRVATWLCSFAVCISFGSALLLPMSIISNEILVHFPNSNYMQWLNSSLIQGLWNQMFLGCNVSLFFLLPFAFFFTESQGFSGSRKGLMSRVYETVLIVGLVMVMVVVMVAVVTSSISTQPDQYSFHRWFSYVPLLYSLISMLGVAMLSVCTPLGFSSLFTLLGETITRPMIGGNVKEEIEMLKFEESSIQRRFKIQGGVDGEERLAMEEKPNLEKLQKEMESLERHLHSSPWERNCVYPFCFLFLVAVTVLALVLVAVNIVALVIYPSEQLTVQEYLLGEESTSQLGAMGVGMEVGLIVYFTCASVVGVYTTPQLRWMVPTPHDTPMTKVIANSIVLLILSSALPLLSRTLGITKFNLIGHFGSLEWLGNFPLLLCYNVLFLVITSIILFLRVKTSILKKASSLLGSRLVYRTKSKRE